MPELLKTALSYGFNGLIMALIFLIAIFPLICIVWGVVDFKRRTKLLKLRPEDFTDVPRWAFYEWQELKLQSIKYFLWGAWGAPAICLLLCFAIRFSTTSLLEKKLMVSALGFVYWTVFLICLLISTLKASKAARISKANDIQWTKISVPDRL